MLRLGIILFIGSLFLIISKSWSANKTSFDIKNSSYTSIDQLSSAITKPPLIKIDYQCSKYGFLSIHSNVTNTSLPIYDFFLFHNEFDLLEIRLHELYDYVTFFLIAESRYTLSGKDKPLYLKENWSKFAKYHNKIRRVDIELSRDTTYQWANEHRMRNEGLRVALLTVPENKYILLTSDVDEIPKARFMNALSHCPLLNPFPSLVLNCDFYYYSYEYRSKFRTYFGSTVTLIDTKQTNPSGNALRDERFHYRKIHSTCFHCTWCFNQLKEVRLKMASYSHLEHNKVEFQSREHILDRYRYGKDLFDRKAEEYIYVNNTDYPELVKLQSERFMFMTNRTKMPNVGFIDAD